MDRIMSASIILLDQNFNANDVDLMVFEPCLIPRRRSLGGNGWQIDEKEVRNNSLDQE